jgi:hypothetical protein
MNPLRLTHHIMIELARGVRGVFICFMVLVLMSGTLAAAQETASDYLEPKLDRAQYDWLCKQLNLGRDQRSIVELLYADYASALGHAASDADAAAEKAGRKAVNDAVSGRARITPDELQRMRIAVLQAYESIGPAADRALADLFDGTRAVLTSEQEPLLDPLIRELNRRVLLHSRQQSSNYEEYAGDGVDVLQLAEEALKDGGELQPLGRGPLADVLASYETQLDALIIATSAEWRAGKLAAKIAQVSKDHVEVTRQNQAAIDRWKRLYDLNQWAVQSVAHVALTNLGEAAQQQWIERFDRACFTWLYPRSKPERQFEWIKKNVQDEQKRQEAAVILDRYLSKRRDLARQAITIMIRARMEFQTMLYAMMDPAGLDDRMRQSLYAELLKNSGEQANLDANVTAELEALLDDAQRKSMREAMKRPEPVRSR